MWNWKTFSLLWSPAPFNFKIFFHWLEHFERRPSWGGSYSLIAINLFAPETKSWSNSWLVSNNRRGSLLINGLRDLPQPVITCSKLTIETVEQGVKYALSFATKTLKLVKWKAWVQVKSLSGQPPRGQISVQSQHQGH